MKDGGSDTFTRDRKSDLRAPARRAEWLWQVMADHDLPANAFRVAWIIAECWNPDSGDAWPSQKWLAEKAGVSVRAVHDLVVSLRERGHLTYVASHGRGRSNRYRLAFQNRKLASGIGDTETEENRKPASGIEERKPEATVRFSERKNRKIGVEETGNSTSKKPEASFILTSYRNLIEEPHIPSAAPAVAVPRAQAGGAASPIVGIGSRPISRKADDANSWGDPDLGLPQPQRSSIDHRSGHRALASSRPTPSRKPSGFDADDQSAEEVYRVGTRVISASDLRLTVNAFFERGLWLDDLGPPPGAPGCLLPAMTSAWSPPPGEHPMVSLPGMMPRSDETVWSLVLLYRDGGMPWPEFYGTEPGTPGCLLPQRFQDGAMVNRKRQEDRDG